MGSTSQVDSDRQGEHGNVRGSERRRLLVDVSRSYWLASIVVWVALLVIAAVAMPEELSTLRGWGLILGAPLLAPLTVPMMIIWGLGNLAQYGNKDGWNHAVALTTSFFAVWTITFLIFRWRGRRRLEQASTKG